MDVAWCRALLGVCLAGAGPAASAQAVDVGAEVSSEVLYEGGYAACEDCDDLDPDASSLAHVSPARTLGPPKSAFGVGSGAISLVHLDFRRWVSRRVSIDLSVAPMLVVNLAQAGATVHVPLGSSATHEKSLLLSGNVGIAIFAALGSGVGSGGHIGYAWMSRTRGRAFSLTAGGLFIGDLWPFEDGVFLPDVRLTWWGVVR
jgi:hypothetical protein